MLTYSNLDLLSSNKPLFSTALRRSCEQLIPEQDWAGLSRTEQDWKEQSKNQTSENYLEWAELKKKLERGRKRKITT